MDRTGKNALWLVAAHAAVLLLCTAGALTRSTQKPAGDCVSWGCGLSPREEALIAIVLWGVPAVTVSLLVSLVAVGVVAAVRDHRKKASPRTTNAPGSLRGRSR